MEGGADDTTNRTIEESSLTPERANTPEIPPPPPPPPTTVKPNESINLNDTIIDRNDCGNNTVKPTFKNLQQAKKRLHAFSVQKLNQLPTSPLAKKVRLDEKIDETAKKTPKRHKDPNEKAKAVIEEIEEIKRNEQAYLESVRASIDKEHFKKIEKKSRHIRKRSPSLEKSKKINITINNNINESSSNKEKKRYPKNWKELQELELSFDELNREFDLPPPKGNNDVPRQLLFELPSLPIIETKIKTLNREDRLVPFQFVRFTKCKPIISFSINFNTIKEKYPSRRTVLETIPKEMAANIEKLHSMSLKFKTDFNIKVRNWFPKSWINYNHECKLLENSVGLSFLQSYTEDDDNEPTTSTNNNNNNSKIDNSGNKIESSNISNKNKEKNIKKTMKKRKKSNKKRTETKKKHKRSKTEEKLKKKKKKKKHTKEKKHRSDEKIEDIDEKTANKVEKIDDGNVEIENNTKDEKNIEIINDEIDNQHDDNEEIEEDRCIKTTPDTEDYHSHWESDDDLTKIKPLRPSIKLNRSWESDEELFERSGNSNNNTNDNNNSNNKRKQCDYNNLEIPLNLTNLITRKSINIIDNNNDEEANNENNKMEILKPVNLNLDLDMMKTDNNNSLNLENQYEEFIKAVSTDSSSFNQQQIEDNNDNKQLIVSNSDNIHNNNNVADDDGGDSSSSDTSTSTSSSSTTSSSTSTSSDNSSTNRNDNNLANNNSKKKKKKKYKLKKSKRKRNKIQDIFNEFDIPVPSDLPDVGNGGNNGNNVLPLPVPSPDRTLLSTTNNDGVDLKKPFIFPTITIQSKKTLLDHTKLKLNDDSDSCDFTEKFLKKSNEIVPEDFPITTTTPMIENEDVKKIKQDKKQTNDNRNSKREQRNHRDQRDRDSKHKNSTKKPLRRRYSSPLLRRYSPTTMKRRHLSPILSQKQRRKSPSSPSRYRRSPKRKRSRSPKSRQITTTTKRALSPINSPLDGFKKSVADSTISDDMLPQPSSTIDDYSQSPISTYNNNNSINIATKFFDKCDNISSMIDNKNANHNNSPKRLSLDDRINQVLGLEKMDNDNKQQEIDNYHDYNNYHQYDQQYYGQYPQNYTNYNLTPVQQSQTTKVVQVGNILQVVPTDEVPHNLIDNKTPETGQKIVQVGNMLQIVPAVLQPTTTIVDNTTPTTIETTPIINQDENNQQIEEYLMKQKSLERKAEREKRRLERTRRRKEKEKKRKEREKRRQLKLKLKTENMIKKALQLEAETLFDEDDDVENSTQWPPIQVVVSTSSDAPNKGILQTGGFSKIDGKKSVQFADGIRPGEGTSPSGGEELSSPPPKTTKRHKKIKLPKKSKKKKIKVKVKRIQQQQQSQPQENGIDDNVGGNDDDNDEDYENLPPPSPPPGSPPPHVFPSRVKEPPFNNINPYIVTNPAYVTNYPRQTLPPSQIMINRPPYMAGSFHPDLHQNSFVGTNHGIPSHH